VDYVEVAKRNRVALPRRLSEGLDWAQPGRELLVVHLAPGALRLLPFDVYGQKVVERRRALLDRPQDLEAAAALPLLEARYSRLHVEQGPRVVLAGALLLHLGIAPSSKERGPRQPAAMNRSPQRPLEFVYVVRLPEALEIWSVAYRDSLLAEESDLLLDLP
jgi:hypothetical protein